MWRHVLGGLQCWRLHILTATAGGTLTARYIRAGYDGTATGEYLTAGNPTNVTVVAGTANVMPVTQHFGEHAIEFTFTPGGDGTFTYVEITGVAPALY